jgi:hypothetical protein
VTRIGKINDQLLAARRAQIEAQRERNRQGIAMKLVDAILTDLEDLNVELAETIPRSLGPRLAALKVVLPADLASIYEPDLRPGLPVGMAMDRLFDLQDELLFRKTGIPREREIPQRPWLPDAREIG